METKVGVHEFYPVVYKEDGRWKGFEIELWEEIAKRRGYQFSYFEESGLTELLRKTESEEYHLSMAGITRTVERNKKLSSSFLTLGTGLIVGVHAKQSLSVLELCTRIFTWAVAKILLIVTVFAVVIAHGYWLLEGGHSVSAPYAPGIIESAWWAFVTFSTVGYGDIYPVTTAGKFFGVFSILTGLAIFGLFIAQLTSSLTEKRIATQVKSVDDLKGKTVAVKTGTTAVPVVRTHGGDPKEYESIQTAVQAVIEGKVDAVVADAPSLQGIKDQPQLFLVGGLFAHQSYAFFAPKESQLINEINESLVGMRDEEFYDIIYNKYFN